jgi:hypothetical protein
MTNPLLLSFFTFDVRFLSLSPGRSQLKTKVFLVLSHVPLRLGLRSFARQVDHGEPRLDADPEVIGFAVLNVPV